MYFSRKQKPTSCSTGKKKKDGKTIIKITSSSFLYIYNCFSYGDERKGEMTAGEESLAYVLKVKKRRKLLTVLES